MHLVCWWLWLFFERERVVRVVAGLEIDRVGFGGKLGWEDFISVPASWLRRRSV